MPFFPYSGEGNPEEHPRENERIFLAYGGIIRGRCRNAGVIVADNEGYPIFGDEEVVLQGPGTYLCMVGLYRRIAFLPTDGRWIESQCAPIPKGKPGLIRLVF